MLQLHDSCLSGFRSAGNHVNQYDLDYNYYSYESIEDCPESKSGAGKGHEAAGLLEPSPTTTEPHEQFQEQEIVEYEIDGGQDKQFHSEDRTSEAAPAFETETTYFPSYDPVTLTKWQFWKGEKKHWTGEMIKPFVNMQMGLELAFSGS